MAKDVCVSLRMPFLKNDLMIAGNPSVAFLMALKVERSKPGGVTGPRMGHSSVGTEKPLWIRVENNAKEKVFMMMVIDEECCLIQKLN